MKDLMKNTFWQLAVVYTLLVALISLNFFEKYVIHFEVLALIIGLLGIYIIGKEKTGNKINKRLHYFLFALAIILILAFRIIPYVGNSIPLGYDAGIYKYTIESGLSSMDEWVLNNAEPLFLYLMEPLKLVFSIQFLLTYGFIGFCLLLGLSIYFVSREFFGNDAGLIALLIYSVSYIQFLTFDYMYYRNVIGLTLALFSIYFMKKAKDSKDSKFLGLSITLWLSIILGGLLGAMHRPTFYIFGLSYFFYAFISPYQNKKYDFRLLNKNILHGVLMLLIAGMFYLGKFRSALAIIGPVANSFISPGSSPGTFISFFSYQFSTLAYIPFALIGFGSLLRKKEFNMLFFWTAVASIIVYFRFFFFNRFIIHLDIALIILAGAGFSILIQNKRKIGAVILIIMLLSAGFATFKEARNAKSLITEDGLNLIKTLENVEEDARIISISSKYSPWVLGYSNRITIAPGLFDENKWSEEEWNIFWESTNIEETKDLMSVYGEGPIYLFAGTKEFNNPCFQEYSSEKEWRIYKYGC